MRLLRLLAAPLVWCWDNLNIHLAPELADFAAENKEWLRVYRMPAYAPDLNPADLGFSVGSGLTALAALSAPLALHASVILVALPLWIVTRTQAPRALVPVLLVANTVLVVLFQVTASRGAETVPGAARLGRGAGLWLAAGCLLVAMTGRLSSAPAALISLSIILFTLAELQQASSAWGLAHGLAPANAQAEYFGTFNLYSVTQSVAGPALLVGAFDWAGSWGWVLIAIVALLAAVLLPAAAAAAEHAASNVDMVQAGQAVVETET